MQYSPGQIIGGRYRLKGLLAIQGLGLAFFGEPLQMTKPITADRVRSIRSQVRFQNVSSSGV